MEISKELLETFELEEIVSIIRERNRNTEAVNVLLRYVFECKQQDVFNCLRKDYHQHGFNSILQDGLSDFVSRMYWQKASIKDVEIDLLVKFMNFQLEVYGYEGSSLEQFITNFSNVEDFFEILCYIQARNSDLTRINNIIGTRVKTSDIEDKISNIYLNQSPGNVYCHLLVSSRPRERYRGIIRNETRDIIHSAKKNLNEKEFSTLIDFYSEARLNTLTGNNPFISAIYPQDLCLAIDFFQKDKNYSHARHLESILPRLEFWQPQRAEMSLDSAYRLNCLYEITALKD